MNATTVKERPFYRSLCGGYVCRYIGPGGCDYEVWTADGATHFANDDRRERARPLKRCVGSWSCAMGSEPADTFTLGFMLCNPRKKIVPLMGNTIIESYEAKFRFKKPLKRLPRWAKELAGAAS